MTAFFMDDLKVINNGYTYKKKCIVTPYKNKKEGLLHKASLLFLIIKNAYSTFNK